MSNNKYHYINHGTKNKRESEKERKERGNQKTRKRPYDEKSGITPRHKLAQKYNVTWHAITRYAERVLEIEPKDLKQDKIELIAKTIRNSLPKHLISETKYNLFDDYYAVVNGNMIVTVTKA